MADAASAARGIAFSFSWLPFAAVGDELYGANFRNRNRFVFSQRRYGAHNLDGWCDALASNARTVCDCMCEHVGLARHRPLCQTCLSQKGRYAKAAGETGKGY